MTGNATPTPDRDPLPKHTTPTWEVELLISGVAVFAMLQLPVWLDRQMFALTPRLDTDLAGVVLPLYVYLKSAALILAVTFGLHLLLRAQWIALVGMHSVYPDGVLWAKLRMGPVRREFEQHRHGSAAQSIERADNRATVVFAIGVMLASLLLHISLLVAVLFALIMAVKSLAAVRVNLFVMFGLCFACILLLLLVSRSVDRFYGHRLRQGGLPRRLLTGTFSMLSRSGIGRRSEVMALLSSHGSERGIHLLTAGAIAVVILAVTFSLSAMKKSVHAGSYALFPYSVDDVHMLRSAYYDDQRDPLHDPAIPFIQSAVIDGSYLRLTVPYRPQHDAPAQRHACARALALAAGAARGEALLDCLARLHAVTLDGRPLATLRYDAGSDPRTDRPALQAMVDVRALAAGRHVLRVARGSGDDGARAGDNADTIVFWR